MLEPSLPFLDRPARLEPDAGTVLSSAMIAAGEEIPPAAAVTSAAAVTASSAATASANTVAAINAQEAAAEAQLAYLTATPGAVLLAGLPSSLPSSSGAWWIDGQLVARS